MIRHHPSADLLAGYASGDTPLAAGLSVAAHLDMCPRCRMAVTSLEDLEGQALQAASDAAVSDDALERVLARLDAPEPPHPVAPIATRLGDVDLPPAVARLGVASRRWISPGFWSARIRAPATYGWHAYLLRAPAGTRIPQHVHGGQEYMCVLMGALDDGKRYGRGDFGQKSSGTEHILEIAPDAPCACIMSVKGGTHWQGWSKLAGPVLGM